MRREGKGTAAHGGAVVVATDRRVGGRLVDFIQTRDDSISST